MMAWHELSGDSFAEMEKMGVKRVKRMLDFRQTEIDLEKKLQDAEPK